MKERESGQALVEYVLLMAVIAALIVLVLRPTRTLMAKLEEPLRNGFVRNYKYGDPKACGKEDPEIQQCSGTPDRHPRYEGAGNFRIFGRGAR